jgi:RNA polymerase-interacting CarD/CdnL/TRCF family regulator
MVTGGNNRKLEIGSLLFFPAHGVATVEGLEERAFGTNPESFYALRLARGDKLLLPVGNVTKAGVRPLVSKTKARELLKTVRTDPTNGSTASWRLRAASYAEGLRSGCPDRYTEILQGLLCRTRVAALSAHDRQLLEVARGYFVAEISAVLGRPASEIEADLAGDPIEAVASSRST